ncbi:MAG: MBL fold metallo-hydrolase [Candidatus Pacebacteria bacterium]|jgi:glyoxylase-like metal-dependent hydrolase (beta-lactamase superfamily II)|nr:MBL fold metallo-hydrolase [Candidatus Paceibacterota bacterium]
MEIKRIVVGQLQTNCYLLIDGGHILVVDPGDEAERIAEEIVRTGAAPVAIVNTHGHFDHIGANAELEKKFGVKVVPNLKEGDILTFGGQKVKVAVTPGHTKDGICLFGEGFVVSGDTLFCGNIGRTDLEGGSDHDMAESLKKLDRLIPEGARVYPGHGEPFSYRKGEALVWLEYLD